MESNYYQSRSGGGRIDTTERFNCIFQQYPERIQLSKKQRAKYYEETSAGLLPVKLAKRVLLGELSWQLKDRKKCLYDNAAQSFVIKNSKVAGTPKIRSINSQDIWTGDPWLRKALATELHAYFAPGIIRQLPEEIFTPSPDTFIHLEYIFYYPFQAREEREYQDYINHAYIRSKIFEDTLVELKIIKNDGPRIVRGGYARYVNVPTEVERRMEVKIHFCKNNQRIN